MYCSWFKTCEALHWIRAWSICHFLLIISTLQFVTLLKFLYLSLFQIKYVCLGNMNKDWRMRYINEAVLSLWSVQLLIKCIWSFWKREGLPCVYLLHKIHVAAPFCVQISASLQRTSSIFCFILFPFFLFFFISFFLRSFR